ncbi:4Fe-4S single cluster domain-containing protein [Actinomadura violacea]|uniref:Anaerobic ribonucleoside-triphosphate reductase-activating protein n=1 Tax=Actinomadura violacea TaxID=2819934 RepID=A0ABS3SA04_9ACTN|nr:4Fe-4S single cluster domain-containing protein [Actinomadura violacea]MBO2465837.1 radical SAM protein [Actinomadura violacea]
MALTWRVHATLARSSANGPGSRFVVWTQGCSLGCAGCFNPETHAPAGPVRTIPEVVAEVLAAGALDGVTVSGGEPLEQPEALAAFCAALRRGPDLGIVVLTGFARAEIERDPVLAVAVADADMVVAGRYNARLHLGAGLRGSSNKEYWPITARYSAEDFRAVPEGEILVAADGTATITGMHPVTGML